jgi:hypothetical protein
MMLPEVMVPEVMARPTPFGSLGPLCFSKR